jgi:hypothetical protein
MIRLNFSLIGILLGVLTLMSLLFAFYDLFIENEGGMGLAGLVGFMLFVLTGCLLILEQAIVRRTNASKKKIFIIELVITIPLFLFLYQAFKILAK